MHPFLSRINHAADIWYVVAFQITWQATLLAMIVLAFVMVGRRWSSPLRYSLLLIALMKFALPPFMPLPTGVFSHVSPKIEVTPQALAPSPVSDIEAMFVRESMPIPNVVPEMNPLEQTSPVVNAVSPQTIRLSIKSWLMLLHLMGLVVVATWIVRSVMVIRRLIRRAESPTVEIQQQFDQLSAQFEMRRSPRLVITDEPCGPAAYGVVQPVVILPRAVVTLDQSALDLIIAHELAHHARQDMVVNWFQLALAAVWWFNPVVWLLNHEIRRLREDCCDDLLLSRKIATDRAYCDTLLTAASKITQQATAEVLLGFGDRLHPLGRRFRRIMDYTLFRSARISRTGILLSIIIAGVVLPGLRRSNAETTFSVLENGAPPQIEVFAERNGDPDFSKVTDMRLRVVDEAGKPIPKFESMKWYADGAFGLWQTGYGGLAFLGRSSTNMSDPIGVFLSAEGYGPSFALFSPNETEQIRRGEKMITMRAGQKVAIQLHLPDGMKLPEDLIPETYFDQQQAEARMSRDASPGYSRRSPGFDALRLKKVGLGRYEFWLNKDSPPFHVAIHSPRFLQFFEAGRFTEADMKNGQLDISIPKPATLDVSFDPGETKDSELPHRSALLLVYWNGRDNSLYRGIPTRDEMTVLGSNPQGSLRPRLTFADLAPGEYRVQLQTMQRGNVKPIANTRLYVGRYSDERVLELESEELKKITMRPTPLDPDAFRGEFTAQLRFLTTDGKPAAGGRVSVTYHDGHYGMHPVYSGVIPTSGEIVVTGITDKDHRSRPTQKPFAVSIDDRSVGTFSLLNEPKVQNFTFTVRANIGDIAPNIELTNFKTGKPLRLQNLRGKVVVLKFLATWSAAGFGSLSDFEELLRHQIEHWHDDVVIIPVCVDTSRPKVERVRLPQGFPDLEFYWSGRDESASPNSSIATALGVETIPNTMLIGRDGRMLWRGRTDDVGGGSLIKRIDEALGK